MPCWPIGGRRRSRTRKRPCSPSSTRSTTRRTRSVRSDIDALKGHGWTEEAIYDAVTVCALFNFYNRWMDATGVPDMPAAAYELSGKRLAEHGYFQGGKMD